MLTEAALPFRSCVALALAALLAPALAAPARAHGEGGVDNSGYHGAFLGDFERVSKKLVDLAEAMPAETYGWRPAEGVRSVSENYMHVAAANYFFASRLGVDRPEGLPESMEEVTDKAKVLELLAASMGQVRAVAEKNASRDLDVKELELFGQQLSARDVYFILMGHLHEHLGQAIAYARSNGVVPPWSRPRSEGDEGGGDS